MPRSPSSQSLACRLVVPGLVLALTGLAVLPAQATPASRQAAPGTAALVLPDPQPVTVGTPAPRPAADPPGSASLWFVGVFQ